MRLLVYNPNTNQDLTAVLAKTVRQLLRRDDVLRSATSSSGEAFIGSDESIAAAREALHRDLSLRASDFDAILLGCFGDLGLDQVRNELKRPVISLSDAFFATLPFLGRRVGVLTTSQFWVGRLAVEAQQRGASRWLAETHSLSISPEEAPDSLRTRCRSILAEIARTGRCEAIVLGGSLLISLSSDLAAGSPLPLFDPLAAGIALCRAAHESLAPPRAAR